MALGPAAICAAYTGRTHGRSNQQCRRTSRTLTNGEPSTHGAIVLKNSTDVRFDIASGFGWVTQKADIPRAAAK
jgi:hypothetical protein